MLPESYITVYNPVGILYNPSRCCRNHSVPIMVLSEPFKTFHNAVGILYHVGGTLQHAECIILLSEPSITRHNVV